LKEELQSGLVERLSVMGCANVLSLFSEISQSTTSSAQIPSPSEQSTTSTGTTSPSSSSSSAPFLYRPPIVEFEAPEIVLAENSQTNPLLSSNVVVVDEFHAWCDSAENGIDIDQQILDEMDA